MSVSKVQITKEFSDGKEIMKHSIISICSIVRDCEKNLNKNIPRIEHLRSFFKDSEVIIFENDSKDDTLEILKNWEKVSPGVKILSESFEVPSIPTQENGRANPYFSIPRIEKMVVYRNKYLEYLNNNAIKRDFVIVIDLDISNFSVDGLIHSFGTSIEWDCISANGISRASNLKKQYHDSYALIEDGKVDEIQTENSIQNNRTHYSYLKPGMPLVPVDSAYGGLALYKWESIRNSYYCCLENENSRVQCKSEHVGLHYMMKRNGHTKIYINPSLIVIYRAITIKFLYAKIKERFLNS